MTKKDLITLSKAQYSQKMTEALYEFFESNVVIPKGVSRHPCADVLHKMAEGEAFQHWNYCEEKWIDGSKSIYYYERYRIKPSEPIYEWQWYKIENDRAVVTGGHYTECEASKFESKYYKLEETKRECKNA